MRDGLRGRGSHSGRGGDYTSSFEEIEEYAALMHGAQLFAYVLGYRYHQRRGKKVYMGIAIAGMLVHGYGVYRHVRALL